MLNILTQGESFVNKLQGILAVCMKRVGMKKNYVSYIDMERGTLHNLDQRTFRTQMTLMFVNRLKKGSVGY